MDNLTQNTLGNISQTPLWLQVWSLKIGHIIAFSVFLILIILIMLFKDRLSRKKSLLRLIRYAVLGISFIYVGLLLKAQPTTTNIVIIINSLKDLEFPLGLYLLEPYIFFSFIFISLTIIVWGRGVFCGWLCPYGAMLELLNKLYDRILPKRRLPIPGKLHWKLVYLKYMVFLLILGASFYNFILSEYMTEVEPFRTFVLKLHRQWYFVLYFLFLTGLSVVFYRAFCRYLCPLGAALAIPSLLRRIPLIRLKRHELCGTCRICSKACPYQAIRPDGVISSTECLDCLDCQINFWDEDICPALKRKKTLKEKNHSSARPAAILLLLAIPLLLPSLATARTLVVGNGYSSISDALEMARDGDTIEVRKGVYKERINVDKRVYLKGIGNPTIISDSGNLIEVTSPGVIIEGFTLTYSSRDKFSLTSQDTAIYVRKGANSVVIRNNRIDKVLFGIWNFEGRDLRIENNTIVGIKEFEAEKRGNCINLTGSLRVQIIKNKLSYCRDGIYMELSHDAVVTDNVIDNSRYSIHTMWVDRITCANNTAHDNLVGFAIMYTDYPKIKNNFAYGNRTHGLLLIQAVRGEIIGNTVIANTKGIFLYNSVYNKILNNLVMNNQVGIHSWGGSQDNFVSRNSIINNEIQVKFVARKDQKWDNNYWSDYIGWDMTGDNIGDMPYESNTVVDHLFWRYPITKILYTSPALHILWMMEKQFPLLEVPKVVDNNPSMLPFHKNWKELWKRYSSYKPDRIYGEIQKLPHVPGRGGI